MNKCVEITEYIAAVETKEEKELKDWIARTLDYTIQTYIRANGPMSQDAFAERVPIGWKSIDNIIKGKHFPGIDTLNSIVIAADSNLAEFFSRMVTRMELAGIRRDTEDEREMIVTLIRGLASPKTKGLVQALAAHVGEILDRS